MARRCPGLVLDGGAANEDVRQRRIWRSGRGQGESGIKEQQGRGSGGWKIDSAELRELLGLQDPNTKCPFKGQIDDQQVWIIYISASFYF